MSNKFKIFLPDNPCRKVGLADSQFLNGEPIKITLIVIFWFKGFCHIGSWYWKKDIPWTSRTIAKVTNILRELANTNNMK